MTARHLLGSSQRNANGSSSENLMHSDVGTRHVFAHAVLFSFGAARLCVASIVLSLRTVFSLFMVFEPFAGLHVRPATARHLLGSSQRNANGSSSENLMHSDVGTRHVFAHAVLFSFGAA